MAKEQNKRRIIEELWRKHIPSSGHQHAEEFFAAGGDSLGATRLLVDLQRRFQKEFAVSLIGEGLTIDRLVSALEDSTIKNIDLGGAPGAWERI